MKNQVLHAIHKFFMQSTWDTMYVINVHSDLRNQWSGLESLFMDITQMVKNCDLCNKNQPAQPKLPIM